MRKRALTEINVLLQSKVIEKCRAKYLYLNLRLISVLHMFLRSPNFQPQSFYKNVLLYETESIHRTYFPIFVEGDWVRGEWGWGKELINEHYLV